MIRIPQTETEFLNALVDAAELGAKKALVTTGAIKGDVSIRQAERLAGAARFRRWRTAGLIAVEKDGIGNKKGRVDLLKLNALMKVDKR